MKARFTPALFAHAEAVLGQLLTFEHPADAVVSRYNSKAAPQGMARVARALKAGDAPSALYHMLGRLRLPSALKQIGMPRSGVQQAAEEVCATPYRNPKVVEYESVKAMLERAYEGVEPRP